MAALAGTRRPLTYLALSIKPLSINGPRDMKKLYSTVLQQLTVHLLPLRVITADVGKVNMKPGGDLGASRSKGSTIRVVELMAHIPGSLLLHHLRKAFSILLGRLAEQV